MGPVPETKMQKLTVFERTLYRISQISLGVGVVLFLLFLWGPFDIEIMLRPILTAFLILFTATAILFLNRTVSGRND